MGDPMLAMTVAMSSIGVIAIAAAAGLKAWSGWLEIRRLELSRDRDEETGAGPSPAARIELADLRERVRKLEAIAAGVDM